MDSLGQRAVTNTTDTILTGDCREILPTLTAGVADVVFFDPAYNNGTDYPGYDDDGTEAEYAAQLDTLCRTVLRVLVPFGSLWVQSGQSIQAEVCVMLKRLGCTGGEV